MRIAIIGAHGNIGSRIASEAMSRGHTVTAIARDPSKVPPSDGMTVAKGDALDDVSIAQAVRDHDAVISAVGIQRSGEAPANLVAVARALVSGLEQAGVKRLLVVGGAGSLEVAPGTMLMDTPDWPAQRQPLSRAHLEALDVYKGSGLQWTYVSPPITISPGERTNSFRVAGDELLRDGNGESRISTEDYAVAVLNEIETPQYVQRRMTAAY
jgi:putative NADH-flavin reductase